MRLSADDCSLYLIYALSHEQYFIEQIFLLAFVDELDHAIPESFCLAFDQCIDALGILPRGLEFDSSVWQVFEAFLFGRFV